MTTKILIISTLKLNIKNYIQAAVKVVNISVNKDRYFSTFDEESIMLSCFVNWCSSCLPNNYDSALQVSVAGRNAGENGFTLIWITDVDLCMTKCLDLDVHGLLTNRISVAIQAINSIDLTLASRYSHILVSTINVVYLHQIRVAVKFLRLHHYKGV